jgi:ComF family protein
MMILKELRDLVVNSLFPQDCQVCGGGVESLDLGIACRSCWGATTLFGPSHPLCPKCGLLLRSAFKGTPRECGRCAPHRYDSARAVGVYERALAATVLRLKTEPHVPRVLTDALGMLARRAAESRADLIVPVPLSRKRLRERGFNQAEVIAKELARKMRVDIDRTSLARTSHTRVHRAGMDERARAASVSGAFAVVRPDLVAGRRILLVDDVMTSGSTLSQCAEELKAGGAERVEAIVLARTV